MARVNLTEDDIWLIASAVENLRGGGRDAESRVEAAWRIASRLEELRDRVAKIVDEHRAAK